MRQVIDHIELEPRARDGFGVIQVGIVAEVCDSHGAKVRIVLDQTPKNPAHAGVHRYPRDNRALESALANLAGLDLTLVRNVPKS